MSDRILNATQPNNYLHLQQKIAIFPRMFDKFLEMSDERFPGMFGDITQNTTLPLIPHVPPIPFLVPVFLVLYIAIPKRLMKTSFHKMFSSFHKMFS